MRSGTKIARAWWVISNQGVLELVKRSLRYLKKRRFRELWACRNRDRAYKLWLKKESKEVGGKLRSAPEKIAGFLYKPTISIIMPVWNAQVEYFEKSIESVFDQTYPFWELCIANVSTEKRVLEIINTYREKDSRIKVACHGKQREIASAINEAIKLASGGFIGFLECTDILAPHAILEIVDLLNEKSDVDFVYTDEDHLSEKGVRQNPLFKPDWSPDLLLSMNYIGHFLMARKDLLERLGDLSIQLEAANGSYYYDLALRLTEITKKIVHLPQVLYHRRISEKKNNAAVTGIEIIEGALKRRDIKGKVLQTNKGHFHIKYSIRDEPLISIIIPTKDKVNFLERSIKSVMGKSTYPKYEIIIVDNDSSKDETFTYLKKLSQVQNCLVLQYSGPFNFSAINNFASLAARGEYLLFLNNDTEVITNDWIEELLSHCQRPEVGAVGAKLLFPNGTIQHCGIIVGLFDVAGHAFYGSPGEEAGYMGFADLTRNYSAVTAACLMMRKDVFNEVGGFDEELDVAYNDVDLCLKAVRKGYFIMWNPHVVLYHHESASRGLYLRERNTQFFCEKWYEFLKQGDPFYNPNLSLNHHDFKIKI